MNTLFHQNIWYFSEEGVHLRKCLSPEHLTVNLHTYEKFEENRACLSFTISVTNDWTSRWLETEEGRKGQIGERRCWVERGIAGATELPWRNAGVSRDLLFAWLGWMEWKLLWSQRRSISAFPVDPWPHHLGSLGNGEFWFSWLICPKWTT